MLTIPLHVPALTAKASGLSVSYMGRLVGTISVLVAAERSTKDVTGANKGAHSIQHPVPVMLPAATT